MKVSKVILIVVALHVLVIGGIFVFEGCTRTKTVPNEMAENESPAPDKATTNNVTSLPTPAGPDSTTPTPAPANAVANITPTAIGPVAPLGTIAPVVPSGRIHTVKKGESMIKIAKAEKVGVNDLLKANNLTKTSTLKIGQKLTIPAAAAKPELATAVASVTGPAPAGAATATVEGTAYVVKSGDSLWKIAHAQKVSVSAIKQANKLSSDSLKVGQKLTIPAATTATVSASATMPAVTTPSTGALASTVADSTTHVVDIGETPAVIAKKYNVKVDDLLKVNKISDPRKLQAGQKLTIPTVATAAPVAAPASVPAVTAPATTTPTTIPTAPAASTMAPTVSGSPIVATASH